MFATAMAYSFDTSLEDIRQGLRIFNTSFYQAPGRLNIFDEHPFKVILDYAHNPAAIKTITNLAARLDVKGKRRIVMAMPGDRRNEDIQEAATIIAKTFDSFVCKADDDRRGRGHDEVPMLIKDTLISNGVSSDCIEVIPSEKDAVEAGLASCAPGDLLIILGDNITRCWKQIVHFNGNENNVSETNDATPSHDFPEKLYEPIEHKFELGEGQRLVHDERGVHIVVDRDEESD
jgi:cyanophycin synthetase